MSFFSWVSSSSILLLVVCLIACNISAVALANKQKTIPTASAKATPTRKPTKYPTTLGPSTANPTSLSASILDDYYEGYENVFGSFYKPSSNPVVAVSSSGKPSLQPSQAPVIKKTKTPMSKPTISPSVASNEYDSYSSYDDSGSGNTPSPSPSNHTPTSFPTIKPSLTPSKPPLVLDKAKELTLDCAYYDQKSCPASTSSCGPCSFDSAKMYYVIQVTFQFTMPDASVKFSDYDNTFPKYSAFPDAVKAYLKEKIGSANNISIKRIGSINQASASLSGSVDYQIMFADTESSKTSTYALLKANSQNLVDQLNQALNKQLNTQDKIYFSGSISPKSDSIIDAGSGKGACVCNDLTSHSPKIHQMTFRNIFMVFISALLIYVSF